MKQIITFVLIALFILQAFPVSVYAAEDVGALRLQLAALTKYLDRIQGKVSLAPLSSEEMRTIIKEGTQWLLESQEPTGHFAYEYVPYEDRYKEDDNIVRQGGALFALGEVYRRQTVKDEDVAVGIEKAIGYFERLTLEEEDGTWKCVANTEKSSQCKLGTTALVLSGILGYVEGNPEVKEEYEDLIHAYTAYLLASQKSAGGFSGSYSTSKGFSPEESPFFNGEALLALVRAYQYGEDADVKNAIDTAFEYLEQKEFESPLYLWIMAALKDMQALWPSERYVTYAREFTIWRMARATRTFNDRNYCAYSEGLASAYSIFNGEPLEQLRFMRQDIDAFNAYHAGLQLTENDSYKLMITNGIPVLGKLTHANLAHGGFLTAHSEPTQRIDFTQHCISSYVQTLVDIDGKEL